MKAFEALEKKVASLIELTQRLRAENLELIEKNAQMTAQIKMLEDTVLAENGRIEEFNQEKVLTKKAVDALIKDIDALVKKSPAT